MFNWELLLRLLVSVILGGFIGLERGRTRHEAGLRTHILVCLGAATVMVLSELIASKYEIYSEVMRMGAQVVSGIGFLGVGSIISDSNKIRGVTTAAGVWTTACVGLVIGSGLYIISVAITLIMLFVMVALKPITKKIGMKKAANTLTVYVDHERTVYVLLKELSHEGIEITKVKYDRENDQLKADIEVELHEGLKVNDLICISADLEGIKEFKVV